MIPRLHCPEARPNWTGALTSAQARKLFRVLRLRAGAEVVLFDGAGGEYAATIDAPRPGAATARVTAARPAPLADAGPRARVGQALCAPNKMDWAVEKMTELGALEIVPLQTAKSAAVKFDLQRARRLAVAACEQCGRARLPALTAPMSLTNFLARPAVGARKIALSPRAERALPEVLRDATTTTTTAETVFLCGPEAGFAADEEEQTAAAGFVPARLGGRGGRILRAETAALAALAMLLATAATDE